MPHLSEKKSLILQHNNQIKNYKQHFIYYYLNVGWLKKSFLFLVSYRLFAGCCFVTFYTRKDALKAQDALHNIKTMTGVSI